MAFLDDRRFRFAFAVVTLFTVLAGDAVRYTVSWFGFGALVIVLAVIAVLLLVRDRDAWLTGPIPYPVAAFLALATLSVFWSFYPGATLLGLAATWLAALAGFTLAVCIDWSTLLRALGWALRLILAGSLLFELAVTFVFREPVLPLFPSPGVVYTDYERLPGLLFWSRNLLMEGDKIQGIVGNSSLLGFIALLGLVVFGIQFAARTVGGTSGLLWFGFAGLMVYLTRSATITLAMVALVAVVLAVILVRRSATERTRRNAYISIGSVIVALTVASVVFRSHVLGALGKTDTLTLRTDIWAAVIDLAEQRPVAGWGWVSYWAPWVPPFNGLAFTSGVRQLHAHNAWLDVWMQLGIIGVVVFGLLIASTVARSWMLAAARPLDGVTRNPAFAALTLLPLLVMAALVVQSFAESRLLVEYGIVLTVLMAVKTGRLESFERRGTLARIT